MTWRAVFAALLTAMFLAACGGGGGGSNTENAQSNTGIATLGSEGGSVVGTDGTSVLVPAGAVSTPVTIRIAKDATDMPALPRHVTAVGDVFTLTPHGIEFAEPVRVTLPRPKRVTLAEEQLRVAKLSPGGTWELLLPEVSDSDLVVNASRFSYFVTVVETYQVPPSIVMPTLAATITALTCNGGSCVAIGPDSAEVLMSVQLNGGMLPSNCANPQLAIAVNGGTWGTWPMIFGGHVTTPIDPMALPLAGVHSLYRFRFSVRTLATTSPVFSRIGTQSTMAVNLHCEGPPVSDTALVTTPLVFPSKSGGALQFSFATSLSSPTCNGGSCANVSGAQTVQTTAAVPARAILPAACESSAPRLQLRRPGGGVVAETSLFTFTESTLLMTRGGSHPFSFTVQAPVPASRLDITAHLVCGSSSYAAGGTISLVFVTPQQATVPSFPTQPRSMAVSVGQTASFTVVADGFTAPTLQWQTRSGESAAWVDVLGATTGTLTTAVTSLADNGRQFKAVATNPMGSVDSAVVTLTVNPSELAPVLTTQPANLSVVFGSDAVFAIVASGTGMPSYQWRFNGSAIAGANAAVLKLSAVNNANAGRYSVEVSNAAGSVTSSEATLDVTAGAPAAVAPTIVTQPAAVSVNEGNTATFAVGVGGTAPFTYQWLKEGQPIEGATNAYYSLAAVTTGRAGNYAVRVSNAAGSVTSASASLSVTAAVAPEAVSISTQPSAQVQLPGGSATFAVAASGTGPLSYQWLKNGTAIPGATGAVLLLGGVTSNDVASYSVTVSNALGSLTSSAASLTVVGAPSINTAPAATSVVEGSTASFSVAASGSGLGYQWTRNGVAISGATSPSYTTPILALGDSGAVYGVVVYSGAGVAISPGALLTVTAAPVATGPLVLATNSNSNSLSVLRADASTGALSSLGTVNTGSYPYKVAISPNGRFAFATNVVSATIQPFSIDQTAGTVTAGSSRGTTNPYGVAVDPQNRFVWVANYAASGTVSTFLIDGSTGALTPSGSTVASGGTFPYAVAVHPTGNFIFVVNEAGGNVAAFTVNASTGVPTLVGSYGTLASPQSLVVSPNGQHLFVAEAGNNRVSAFAINSSTGALTSAGSVFVNGAGSPAGIVAHPGGQMLYVANANSSNVAMLSVNPSTGALANVGTPLATGSGPNGLALNSAGTRLYVANAGGNSVSTFSVSDLDKTLTALGAAIATGGSLPSGIAVSP